MYIVYRAVSPSGKYYVGITNNFKRRLKEHRSSPYIFGKALRKYGHNNFTYHLLEVATVEEALDWERLLVKHEADDCYNMCPGGILADVLVSNNPMHREDVLLNHPNLFTTENNPMNNPLCKQKMIESQDCKKVSALGTIYYGVREAARALDVSRQCLIHRLKSSNFPEYFYL